MRTLINILGKIRPGDKILMQKMDSLGRLRKPELIIVVGVDVWDVAPAVYYTKYKEFEGLANVDYPKVLSFGEWMEYWLILGHWQKMPTFRNLLKAYRKRKTQ